MGGWGNSKGFVNFVIELEKWSDFLRIFFIAQPNVYEGPKFRTNLGYKRSFHRYAQGTCGKIQQRGKAGDSETRKKKDVIFFTHSCHWNLACASRTLQESSRLSIVFFFCPRADGHWKIRRAVYFLLLGLPGRGFVTVGAAFLTVTGRKVPRNGSKKKGWDGGSDSSLENGRFKNYILLWTVRTSGTSLRQLHKRSNLQRKLWFFFYCCWFSVFDFPTENFSRKWPERFVDSSEKKMPHLFYFFFQFTVETDGASKYCCWAWWRRQRSRKNVKISGVQYKILRRVKTVIHIVLQRWKLVLSGSIVRGWTNIQTFFFRFVLFSCTIAFRETVKWSVKTVMSRGRRRRNHFPWLYSRSWRWWFVRWRTPRTLSPDGCWIMNVFIPRGKRKEKGLNWLRQTVGEGRNIRARKFGEVMGIECGSSAHGEAAIFPASSNNHKFEKS